MEKINFVNGQSPYISATNLNNLQDKIEQAIAEVDGKSRICFGILSNFTATEQGYNLIPIDTVFDQKGVGFKLENNKIIIGNGISQIKVCANFVAICQTASNVALNFDVYKNGVEEINCMSTISNTTQFNYNRTIAPSLILDVKENDYIEFKMYARARRCIIFTKK